MTREIDRRLIEGNGGTVTLVADDPLDLLSFRVILADTLGTVFAEIGPCDSQTAVDAFHHPFAYTHVPDVFKRDSE